MVNDKYVTHFTVNYNCVTTIVLKQNIVYVWFVEF